MDGKVLQAIVEIVGSVSPTLSKSVKDTCEKLDKVNVKALAVGAAAAAGTIAVGKAAIEAGKYLVDLGSQFDGVTDSIRVGTGATGEALDALVEDFDAVYSSVPTTMEDASKAIADYNTRLGLTGENLQGVSKQAIQVADMLGEDLGGVIESSSKAFQQWNVDADDMGGAMDYVFKVSQSTGEGFTDLMNTVQSFGPQLQDMGYSFEEATALIGQLEKAGVNTEEVLGAMKKSTAAFAKEGIGAAEGLEMYADAIMNAKDMTQATAIASEVFGTRAGSTMAAAIRDGSISVDQLTESLMENAETISGCAADTYDFAEQLQMFKQQAEVALKPLAAAMFDMLNKLMPVVGELFESLMPAVSQIVEGLVPVISNIAESLMPKIVEVLQKVMPVVLQLIDAILPVVIQLLNSLMPIFDTVLILLEPILNLVIGLLSPILNLISSLSPLISVLLSLINTALKPLMPIIQLVSDHISGSLGAAVESIQPIISALTGVFENLIGFIQNAFAGNWEGAWDNVIGIFKNCWEGLKAIVKAPVNFIIGCINGLIKGLNKLKIPDWVPGVGGKGLNIPLIPQLATGGFTDGISIAGEAGMEAVISFDPAYRDENIDYWLQAGRMLGIQLAEAESGSREAPLLSQAGKLMELDDFSLGQLTEATIIYYDFRGLSFSPNVEAGASANKEDIIAALKEQASEFFDWLDEWLRRKEVGEFDRVGIY